MSRSPSPKYQVIALFDVLGFSNLFAEHGLDEINARYRKVRKLLGRSFRWEARVATFSDTILVFSTDLTDWQRDRETGDVRLWLDERTRNDFDVFLRWCALLMAHCFDVGLPLRGGIAAGYCQVQHTTGTYLGQPIIDAYTLEQEQDWAGVALHDTVVDLADLSGSSRSTVQPWKIPWKVRDEKPDQGWTLDWPRFTDVPFDSRERLLSVLRMHEDTKFYHRWQNTTEFFESRYELLRPPVDDGRVLLGDYPRSTWGPSGFRKDGLADWAEERGLTIESTNWRVLIEEN